MQLAPLPGRSSGEFAWHPAPAFPWRMVKQMTKAFHVLRRQETPGETIQSLDALPSHERAFYQEIELGD